MNILILGGQGFIGHNLSLKLMEKGHCLTIFTRKIKKNILIPGCKYVEGDFNNIKKYSYMFKDIDLVYHLISTTLPKSSNEDPIYDIQSNLVNTVEILNMCCQYSVEKVIFTSSGGTVYGNPKNTPILESHPTNPICSYGITKLAIEKYLFMYKHLYNLDYEILRISNPYGPFQVGVKAQGVIGVFLNKILNNEPIEIYGDGEISRDYIYIDDVVSALIETIQNDNTDKVLNIASGKNLTINDLVKIIEEVVNVEIKINYKASRLLDVSNTSLEISKARELLVWQPKFDIKKGIEITWDWYKSQNEL